MRYESIDMQHDLFRSVHDLDMRSHFQNDLLRSYYSSFDASQTEKYDAGTVNLPADGGGIKLQPFGFSAIAQKRVAIATQNFA